MRKGAGNRDLQGRFQTNEKDLGDTTQPTKKILRGMDILPIEGRGDPTSTMLWSPRKRDGQKIPLEAEGEVSDNETSDEEEAKLEGSQEEEALDGGDQRCLNDEPEHQEKGDGTALGGELQTQSGSEERIQRDVDKHGSKAEIGGENYGAGLGSPRTCRR